ncbi:hypothetical protein Scep_020360 [Stephania cephalantha]|uniref:Uncharacterized protein n=1 Tax=Stephania cephalantha TaxID=152367 RepID=A0AAP0NQR3_9MAGN
MLPFPTHNLYFFISFSTHELVSFFANSSLLIRTTHALTDLPSPLQLSTQSSSIYPLNLLGSSQSYFPLESSSLFAVAIALRPPPR